MSTIALYSNEINQMPCLIKDMKNTVSDYKSELSALIQASVSKHLNTQLVFNRPSLFL